MHHCFKNLVAHREATHAYISQSDWDRNAHLGWYPGADGPGHYEMDVEWWHAGPPLHEEPRITFIKFHRVEQCPTCGEEL